MKTVKTALKIACMNFKKDLVLHVSGSNSFYVF